MIFRPEEMIIRLDLPNDLKRGYKTQKLPLLKRYPEAVIQYSNSRKHFRTVKLEKKKVIVFDGAQRMIRTGENIKD